MIVLCVVAACGSGPAYKVSVTEPYEVGEDVIVAVRVRQLSEDGGFVVVTRPDGTEVRQPVPLDVEVNRVRTAPPILRPHTPPTINALGAYRIELRDGANKVLAKHELVVQVDKLNDLLPNDEVAGYKPISRFARARQSGAQRWKTYGAIYEHPYRSEARIEVAIEDAGAAIDAAWRPYKEEGVPSVILDNNVRFRERTEGSVVASWISGKRVIAMRAETLVDLERGLIGHFLERFPSTL